MSFANLLRISFDFGRRNLGLSRHRLRVESLDLIRFFPFFGKRMSCGELSGFHDLYRNELFSHFMLDFKESNLLNHELISLFKWMILFGITSYYGP